MKFKTLITTTLLASAMAMPQVVMSEAAQDTTAPFSAPVNLDFRVIIPGFLNFQVGAAGAVIDLLDLTVPAANVGDTVDLPFTGGTPGGGIVAVSIKCNAGQTLITETNNGTTGLANGAGAFIPYSEILTVSDLGALPAPLLSNAASNTSSPTLNGGNVTNRSALWTYTYDNEQVYDSGTYGTSVNGGRVTYTASVL